ncbi:MAG: hypothetical protein ACTSWX_13750 [Promethearchaeota archaeon]
MAKKKSSKKVKKKSTKKTAKTKVQSKKSSAKASKKKSKSSKAVSSKAQSKKSSKKRSPQKSDNKTSLKKLNYSEIDKRIMEILLTKDSVVISDVKTQLNLTDSEVTKSIKRLESKKKITSKSIMDKSKWTTAIFKIDDYGLTLTSKTKKNSQKLVWDTFNDCPCFLCPKVHKCSSGQNYNNPKSCVDLSNWLDASVNNIPYISPYHPNFELKKKKSQSNVKDEKAKIGA